MAQTLVVDLGDTFATIVFADDGDLDITVENITYLRVALQHLCMVPAKPVKPAPERPPRERKPRGRIDQRKVRQWAKQHGYEIGEHGRIPSDVKEAYEQAQREGEEAWAASSAPVTSLESRRGEQSQGS